jgi:hypothetical protein
MEIRSRKSTARWGNRGTSSESRGTAPGRESRLSPAAGANPDQSPTGGGGRGPLPLGAPLRGRVDEGWPPGRARRLLRRCHGHRGQEDKGAHCRRLDVRTAPALAGDDRGGAEDSGHSLHSATRAVRRVWPDGAVPMTFLHFTGRNRSRAEAGKRNEPARR